MSNFVIPFKTKQEKIKEGYFKGHEVKKVQCPVCNEWFNYYYEYDLRGVKLHIRKWASKEATAHALGEIKKMPHLIFWKENARIVDAVPKNREWML